ncbi:MAG: RHS repeat-associated core domain-containing protein, partial [Acidimicrobiales bacterium]
PGHASGARVFGFQGTYSTSSGLDYMVNRYYTPKAAEFLSVDPELTSTHQPYAFGGGDPLNETDPLGLEWYWVHTTWHTYQGTKYAYECGGSVGHRSHNGTSGDHCGSKWCTNDGPCTTHAARGFDDAYGTPVASDAPGESASGAPTNVVAQFLQAMAEFTAFLRAVVANQQQLQEDRNAEQRSEEGPIDPATMGPIYPPSSDAGTNNGGRKLTGFGAVARTADVLGSAATCGATGGEIGGLFGFGGAIAGAAIGFFGCGIAAGVTGNWTEPPGPPSP